MDQILSHLFAIIFDKRNPAAEIRLLGKFIDSLKNYFPVIICRMCFSGKDYLHRANEYHRHR